jgi:hypothetical protein
MLLDPINAITSINFYRKVAGQGASRTFGYLVYVTLLFSIAGTLALKVRVGPEIDKTFVWLATSMPTVTLNAGKVTSTAAAPVTVRHPDISEIAVVVDTARVEPVGSDVLEQQKVLAYLTGSALYVKGAQGHVEVYDLSKAVTPKPVVIDAAFYQNASRLLSKLLYPFAFVFGFFFTLLWKAGSALIYALVGMILNAFAEAGQTFGSLFNMAAYAQTLVIALQAIFLFMPVSPPAFSLIALVTTGVYLWLALKRLKTPPPAAA